MRRERIRKPAPRRSRPSPLPETVYPAKYRRIREELGLDDPKPTPEPGH